MTSWTQQNRLSPYRSNLDNKHTDSNGLTPRELEMMVMHRLLRIFDLKKVLDRSSCGLFPLSSAIILSTSVGLQEQQTSIGQISYLAARSERADDLALESSDSSRRSFPPPFHHVPSARTSLHAQLPMTLYYPGKPPVDIEPSRFRIPRDPRRLPPNRITSLSSIR